MDKIYFTFMIIDLYCDTMLFLIIDKKNFKILKFKLKHIFLEFFFCFICSFVCWESIRLKLLKMIDKKML